MNRTTEDWAANLLADTSPEMLSIWADVLEEAEDPACEGVREYLVGEGPELDHYGESCSEYTWWRRRLPREVFYALPRCEFDRGEANYRYKKGNPASRALAHYTALHDAATAYASMPEAWKRERRERLTKENKPCLT